MQVKYLITSYWRVVEEDGDTEDIKQDLSELYKDPLFIFFDGFNKSFFALMNGVIFVEKEHAFEIKCGNKN